MKIFTSWLIFSRVVLFASIAILNIFSCHWQVAYAAESNANVPRWQPHDWAFTSKAEPTNPFTVGFSADVSGPHGVKMRMPGFYDGNHVWKIRFSAPTEGMWSFTTRSNDKNLDQQHVTFFCIRNPDPNVHGSIEVDPKHMHHFLYEDGTHWFPIGYEADWLWALDMTDPTLKTLNPFLDKISASGFNFVILNTYAYDSYWRRGKTGPDDFGPSALYAWEGSNDAPDQTKFNLAYWQHYDQMMDALARRGIVAHILLKVYNKLVNWPHVGSAEDDQFFRWVIARYAAYPNVIWDIAKEAQHEKSEAYKLDRVKFVRANDPYHRLLTMHDDVATYDRGDYDRLLDFRTDQQHTKQHETMLVHLAQNSWPVLNSEFGYECGPKGPNDKTYSQAQSAEEVCRRAWEISLTGGYTAYYYTYTAWDVMRLEDTPPGYAYFKNLSDFFHGTDYWLLTASDNLVSSGYCLANRGKEYVVFQNQAAPFTLTLNGVAASLKAEWYLPFSGKRLDAGMLSNGVASLTPPQEVGTGPIALHVWNPKDRG